MLSLPIAFVVPLGALPRSFAPRVAACESPPTAPSWLRAADGDGHSPHHGPQRRAQFSDVSSRLESSRLVAPVCQSTTAQALSGRVRPRGVVLFGLDDTIERRRGEQITAKGIYRDPVRSSHAHMVKASGLRWLGCMVCCP